MKTQERIAKKGEKILIVAEEDSFGFYENGYVFTVSDVDSEDHECTPGFVNEVEEIEPNPNCKPDKFMGIFAREYVVIIPEGENNHES